METRKEGKGKEREREREGKGREGKQVGAAKEAGKEAGKRREGSSRSSDKAQTEKGLQEDRNEAGNQQEINTKLTGVQGESRKGIGKQHQKQQPRAGKDEQRRSSLRGTSRGEAEEKQNL